jgi:hypothetical protein
MASKANHGTIPYLDRPIFPLAVALSRILENIETKLTEEKLEIGERARFDQRTELIRGLLATRPIS